MKKMLILAMVLIAVPAMAAVNFDVTNDGTEVTLSYSSDEANDVRAFALDVELDAGTIVSVDSVNGEYDIYPGSIVIIEGEVNEPGSAVCDPSYPDTLGGVGTAGMTLEMGNLDVNDPAQSGTICVFTVSDLPDTVTVSANAIRGGAVVMEDPEQAVTTNLPLSVEIDEDAVCYGDIAGSSPSDMTPNGVVDIVDLQVLASQLLPYAPTYSVSPVPAGFEACDVAGSTPSPTGPNGTLDIVDLQVLAGHLLPYAPTYTAPCIELVE